MVTALKVQHPDKLEKCKRFTLKLNTQKAQTLNCNSIITDECQSRSTLHNLTYTNIEIFRHETKHSKYSETTKNWSEYIHKWYNDCVGVKIIFKLKWNQKFIDLLCTYSDLMDTYITVWSKSDQRITCKTKRIEYLRCCITPHRWFQNHLPIRPYVIFYSLPCSIQSQTTYLNEMISFHRRCYQNKNLYM